MRLRVFRSCGYTSSRREADELIKAGLVKVNGTIILEMGYRVKDNDTRLLVKPISRIVIVWILKSLVR